MTPRFIKAVNDLVTSHDATCQGFLDQAKVKAERATPYVSAAVEFWAKLKRIKAPDDLIRNRSIREGLIATAGVSTKARGYLNEDDITQILSGVLEGIPDDRKARFREEVFYRYLLTKGASLDGEMRNYTGATGARLFVAALLRALESRHDPQVYMADLAGPTKLPEAQLLAESHKVQKVAWERRAILFDRRVALVQKSVDVILVDATNQLSDADLLKRHDLFLACGELKGGIDPAGADEHWKTAKTALARVQEAFAAEGLALSLFFVGAAIASAMAHEIYGMLLRGELAHAANLTVSRQVEDLASWLVGL
jgi:type II restriction enzyme